MTDKEQELKKLKRKRTTQRNNCTRFATSLNGSNDSTDPAEIEHISDRLQDTLNMLLTLDDYIHDMLTDEEYEADAQTCEEYLDRSKRALQHAKTLLTKKKDKPGVLSTTNNYSDGIPTVIQGVKLPTIRLEPFSGDIETWCRFWEQFQSSVDKNPTISDINKHVFLRGYLEGEPKRLIDGIAVSADTYEQTKKILVARYGDKDRIIQAHLDFLENLRPALSESPQELNSTYVECHRRVQALIALGEDVNLYGRILAPKILRAFPAEICRRWLIHAKRENIKEGHMMSLMAFLNEEVEGSLTTEKIRGETTTSAPSFYTPTAATLQISAKREKSKPRWKKTINPFCVFCENKGHWAQECKEITNLEDRIQKLRLSTRCFLCLNRGHTVHQCNKKGKVSCSNCKQLHHISVCNANNTPPTTVSKIQVAISHLSFLQTARVWIKGPTGISKLTRCILDAGSQSSFIAQVLVDTLKLNVTDKRDLSVKSFEATSTGSQLRRLVQFDIIGFSTRKTVTLTAFESDNTYSSHPSVTQDFSNLTLADPGTNNEELPIEILIGADHYWKIVKMEQPMPITPSLVLLPTVFGWVLTGNRSGASVNHVTTYHISTTDCEISDESMRQFWDLETIGIRETHGRQMSGKDATILHEFHKTYCIQDGRRVVSLPRKKGVILSNNLPIAERRFQTLEHRMQHDSVFKAMYHAHMLDYIVKEQVEIAPTNETPGNVFYLPHHAVKKQKKDGTKWRIVFDASSHERGQPALNDALEMGPNLLPEIVATLLRFRVYPTALVCDGSQAFLQLTLHENDRDLTRFLWYRVEPHVDGITQASTDIVPYRFRRLPFGLTSSPFLLSATLRELAAMYHEKYPTAAQLLDSCTFMDDFAASVDNDNLAVTVYYELIALLRHIKLPLSKWFTNSLPLREIWRAEGQEVKSETRVLGVNWNAQSDLLFATPEDITHELVDKPATKRLLLRVTARFYDPLGLFSPVLIIGKILFQDTWCKGLKWDSILPVDLGQRWQAWNSNLSYLSSIQVPRWIGVSTLSDNLSVHVFCDASERAYGAVLYVRSTTDNTCNVKLVFSKNRLSPVKRVTLPRLELLAALVGSRLLRYFCKETGIDSSCATLWSDSAVTLGWIRNNPNRWKTFVCNRVTEIHTYTLSRQWRHCPGIENPADYLSRGLQAKELSLKDSWWKGPSWLVQHPNSWPRDITVPDTALPEEKKISQVLVVTAPETLFRASRYSSYWKILHVTAWILRFVRCIKEKRKGCVNYLSAEEIETARMYWIRQVQRECFGTELASLKKSKPLPKSSKIFRFNPFLRDDIIRLGGRLQFADLTNDERHPVLLDGSHAFTYLLIRQTHIRLHHMGVRVILEELRSEFWILRARQVIKKVLHECLPCKISHKKRCEEIEAPLPLDRVRSTRPFAVTGIDFAGPLYIKSGNEMKKAYIVLFTCATVRAIHLELATDLSTDKFLMAFQRFVGRRGVPRIIYSDNAQTFQAANRELQLSKVLTDPKTHEYLAHHNVTWKFIAPRAAWWGGWWERMIGSTKRCLRKVLGRSQVDEEGLNTVLISIEATLNSRPIVQDGSNLEALTPSHFLNGEKLTTIPNGPEPDGRKDLTKEFRKKMKISEDFWRRWKKEYLLQLRSYHEVKCPAGKHPKLRVGDVALLQEDVLPRHMWKRARVDEVLQGRDGRVRTAILRLPDGTRISRPVQLVIPLEIDQGGEDVEDTE